MKAPDGGVASRSRSSCATPTLRHPRAEEVAEPKRQPGKDIPLTGGARVAACLTELGLLDDYRIVIHPIVLGGGPRLFLLPKERIGLTLTDSCTFDAQTVLLRYERRE